MMQKSRHGYGRLRMTPRAARRATPAVDPEAARVAAARRLAATYIAARLPELAGVAPTLTKRQAAPPSPELLARLGLDRSELGAHVGTQYTFTFTGACKGPDGGATPVVAAVTVDDRQQIVKTSVSR
jgi:hypothetical protein